MEDARLLSGGYVVLPLATYEALMKRCEMKFVPVMKTETTDPKPTKNDDKEEKASAPDKATEKKCERKPDQAEKLRKMVRAREVDHGKVNALHRAGWSAKDIADEMHISIATVYNHIDK